MEDGDRKRTKEQTRKQVSADDFPGEKMSVTKKKNTLQPGSWDSSTKTPGTWEAAFITAAASWAIINQL